MSTRATIQLTILGQQLSASFDVPAHPISPQPALPAAYAIADAVVTIASQASEAQGKPISCRRGCAACCRQLVTLAPVEAIAVADLIEALPSDPQEKIRARFAEAIRIMRQTNLVEPGSPDHAPVLRAPRAKNAEEAFNALLDAYFDLRIPCPFLENESCSIYAARPAVCREYVITSPPDNCNHVGRKPTRGIHLPVYLSDQLVPFGLHNPTSGHLKKIPLPFALAWSAHHRHLFQPPSNAKPLLQNLIARIHQK
jgi:Fe-S-cluster containining protein